jgi:hypothetical protein
MLNCWGKIICLALGVCSVTHTLPSGKMTFYRESLLWTIQRLKEVKDKITGGELKQAKDKLGVVEYPIRDFIEPCNYMLPQLHVEIGLVLEICFRMM